jgi:hypothetical protein
MMERSPEVMKDIFDKAQEYRRLIRREATAHAVSAEYHRHKDMWLGLLMTTVATLVTTGIFTSLISQLQLDGNAPVPLQLPRGWLLMVFLAVGVLSIAAPILTNLHTRLHDAADAASHNATAGRLRGVLNDVELFLLRYPADSPGDRNEALDELKAIMATYSQILATSISMPAQAYRAADRELLRDEGGGRKHESNPLGRRIGWWSQ